MNTILDEIGELRQDQWDYYSEINSESVLPNPFLSSEITHEDFIKRYFQRSGKFEIFDELDVTNSLSKFCKHTNSIFFLGCILYYNTELSDKIFPNLLSHANYHRFPFVWYLACLFHDLGYEYEQGKKLNDKISNIDSLLRQFEITNVLLEKQPAGVSEILFNSIPNYFLYRKSKDLVDHGILAGMYLYDRLVKIRTRRASESNDTRYWGQDLEAQYAIAAATIATHNIFVNQDESIEEYGRFDLSNLNAFAPMKMADFPFLYLLGIVDTLDPIKAYKEVNEDANKILNTITIKVQQSVIEFSCIEDSPLSFTKLINKAKNLDNWLNIGITSNPDSLRLELH
jgi:hypothetical protein